jgi:hypothetical protein
MQIQTHMKFGSGFAPAVLCPVDAGGHERDGAGVHHMNDAAKTPCQSFATTSCAKSRRKLLELIKHRPEQPFSQRSVAVFIGVGKIVAAGRSRSAQARKRAAVHPQCVTDVVQTDGVSQLCKEHTHYVTPRTEGSRHGIHASLARKFGNKLRRNQIAKLPQNIELGCGWFGVSFFHLCRVTELKSHANHFFLWFNQDSYGMAMVPIWRRKTSD